MTDPYTPRPEHKFTFGLWTVGNPGRDPFGNVVRDDLDPVETVQRLSDLGAYGVCFHDNDLVPYGASPTERQTILKRFRHALDETGMKVPMSTTNLFWRPIFKEGAFTANDPAIRRFAVKKTCEAMELGAELGAEVQVMWGGREGVEADAAKDVRAALDRYKEAVDLCCEHVRTQGLGLRIALEPKPNEPRGDILLPTVGHALAFIGELEWPELVGLNPEFAHETMSGLSFSHAVAQTLWHGKLFHIDLNAQRIGKFDQDFRFGSEGIRDAFYVVKLLEDAGWDGMRHFDAHPYRTEDADGVWDFARGCMRTYLILADKACRFDEDTEIQDALRSAQAPKLLERTTPAGGLSEILTSAYDEEALAAQGYGLERLDQLVTELLLGVRVPLVAGVDSSTSACKVRVYDLDTGAVVASGRAPHPPTTPPRSEQDPREWETAFRAACAQAGVPDAHRPAALAVAAQQHGLVVLDGAGEALRPAKLWNDTESAPDAETLLAALPDGPAGWAAACGSVPVPSFTITKLHWLRRCEPEVLLRAASVMLPHDWLTFRLTGRRVTDRGDASGTGYWSPRESRYRYDLLGLVDPTMAWEGLLPEVLAPHAVAGEWRDAGAVVGPGTGDNMAAALGLGLRPGDLVLSLGTSGTAFRVSDQPAADPTGAVAGFADATGRYLPLVCTMNATKVTDTLAALLGLDHERFDLLALEAPAGAGVVLVPHLDGERTPNRPHATGTLSGIRNDVTPALLARAAVEGVVCNLLAAAEPLGSPGADGRVVLIGGVVRSPAYRRVVADLTGRVVQVPSDDELVAGGAAVQAAAVHLGCHFAEVAKAWDLGHGAVVEPDDSVDRATIRAAYAAAAAIG